MQDLQILKFKSSSDVIIAKIGSKKAQICISYAKGDRRIKKGRKKDFKKGLKTNGYIKYNLW